jgi:dimethylhistidine N-methyltransferase
MMAAIAQRAPRPKADAASAAFLHDVIEGLSARPKRLPPKYFYDEIGSKLFEQITELPEYYLTRTELSILQTHASDIVALLPARKTALIEFGSGSTRKARIMLAASQSIAAYVPVDISAEMLANEAAQLRRDHPQLSVLPVAGDFCKPFELPDAIAGFARFGFFPGSTIGNFEPHDASGFLRHAGRMLGSGALLIVGIDLVKDPAILNAAYEDAAGITAEFNLNLLARINHELGANFDLSAFCHQAFYNSERTRIEMHLVSRKRQRARVAGRTFEFRIGETIHTESSYKYKTETFRAMARGAGWSPAAAWVDPAGYFSIQALMLTDDVG